MSDDSAPETGDSQGEKRRLVLNPSSGHGDHAERARELAAEYGFSVVETQRRGHGVDLARAAAEDGVDLLGVCGGDGTLHEVVDGLYGCDGLGSTTVGVIPGGTENFVARYLDVDSMARGFEVATGGRTERIDLGLAGTEPFVLSAIAGLPADASAAATQELKQRFGSLAFPIGAVREGVAFDGLRAEVAVQSTEGQVGWSGEALAVLVGNVRRFGGEGGRANAVDGRLEVTIVEEMPAPELLAEAVKQRLLHEESAHVTNLRATGLDVATIDESPVRFSLDGEIETLDEVRMRVLPSALDIAVGPGYTPESSAGDGSRSPP